MKRAKNPCLGCIHRHIGCHVDCERYAEWREYRSAELKHLRKDDDAVGFKLAGIRKARAYMHKHKQK